MDVLRGRPALARRPRRPIAENQNLAPVRETKTANVESVAESVFGDVPARLIVHGPAAVGAHRLDLDDRLAEPCLRGGLHDLGEPRVERRDHRAIERINRIETHRAIE
jgi:hypothetical protein